VDYKELIEKTCNFEEYGEVYSNWEKAVEFCRQIPDVPQEDENIIHFHWRTKPHGFGRKQVLPIKSAIVTQDLRKTKIILWTYSVDELMENELMQELLPYIELRHLDIKKESIGTPLEGSSLLDIEDGLGFLDGDLIRLVLVHNYGGVYVDMDVVLLRSFAPLMHWEFLYQWGNGALHGINGALMHFKKKSFLSSEMIKMLMSIPPKPNSNDWGTGVYNRVRKFNKNFIVYPCSFFNTEWHTPHISLGGNESSFVKNPYSAELYEGVFAWHWHNQWQKPVQEGSKWYILEQMINEKFTKMEESNG